MVHMDFTRDGIDGPADSGDLPLCACGFTAVRRAGELCLECEYDERDAARVAAGDIAVTAELPAVSMTELVFGGGR